MRRTDIAIVGGGLAGSTAAAMLGRAGFDAVLIDPQRLPVRFPLREARRLAGSPGPSDRPRRRHPAGRNARPGSVDSPLRPPARQAPQPPIRHSLPRPGEHHPRRHPARRAVHPRQGCGDFDQRDRQTIALASGEEIFPRLVVLANGLNIGLRHTLGMAREVVSSCHSISIGFDLEPVGRPGFEFRALTYSPERAGDRMAYLTLFPVGSTTQANLFVYRDMDDPWLRALRAEPLAALFALMPGERLELSNR